MTAVVAPSRRSEWAAGARAVVPMLLGVAPFGFAIGATAVERELALAGWATAPLLFAGASQMAVIDLIDSGATTLVVVVTVLAINLRFTLFAASLAPHWREASGRWRAAASYTIVDQLSVVALARYEGAPASPAEKRAFYTGAAVALWVGWVGVTTVGVVVGGSLPAALGLDMALPLAIVGLVAASVRDRAGLVAAAVAAAIAVPATALPYRSGVIVAGVTALAVVGRGNRS